MRDWRELREEIALWEDDFTLVVNKPPGLSVMGERHDTDLVTIAADAGESLRWVNRIDKVTSGAVVLAKTLEAHGALTRQFAKRAVDKGYLAICQPGGLPEKGVIDLPLFTAGSGRVRVAAERQHIERDPAAGRWYVKPDNLLPRRSYPSRTNYVNLWDDSQRVVVLAMPVTGRRHQIRVHLAWIGHAIIGDPLFNKKADTSIPRAYLHSLRIAFTTAGSRPRWIEVNALPGTDFWEPVREHLAPRSPDDILTVAKIALNNQDTAESAHTATRPN
ncbi:MAG TPA: RNA pseudouridine synthase [Pseudonocardiaceae bacterium]|nr:RNA pseudouridine synthase [Pseudonocardiaceae bacterium]